MVRIIRALMGLLGDDPNDTADYFGTVAATACCLVIISTLITRGYFLEVLAAAIIGFVYCTQSR